ncbi:MAG: hypothetical protein M1820_001827 [Bogoriella megaspora]|nr:MAG: hypothetical protein M1820_001827 [Bogoriella megaspora]
MPRPPRNKMLKRAIENEEADQSRKQPRVEPEDERLDRLGGEVEQMRHSIRSLENEIQDKRKLERRVKTLETKNRYLFNLFHSSLPLNTLDKYTLARVYEDAYFRSIRFKRIEAEVHEVLRLPLSELACFLEAGRLKELILEMEHYAWLPRSALEGFRLFGEFAGRFDWDFCEEVEGQQDCADRKRYRYNHSTIYNEVSDAMKIFDDCFLRVAIHQWEETRGTWDIEQEEEEEKEWFGEFGDGLLKTLSDVVEQETPRGHDTHMKMTWDFLIAVKQHRRASEAASCLRGKLPPELILMVTNYTQHPNHQVSWEDLGQRFPSKIPGTHPGECDLSCDGKKNCPGMSWLEWSHKRQGWATIHAAGVCPGICQNHHYTPPSLQASDFFKEQIAHRRIPWDEW